MYLTRAFGNSKILLEDLRVDPFAEGNEAIYLATRNGHHGIAKLLSEDKKIRTGGKRDWFTETMADRLAYGY
jgi:hypothetical protein